MGGLFFVCGSVVGAAFAWIVGRGNRSCSTAVTLTGVSCGLLGALTSMSGGTMAPMTQAGFGLLGAAAPLTLCVTSVHTAVTTAGVSSAVGRYSATLVLVLVYGTGCATAGFVSATGVRHLSHNGNMGEAADHSNLSPTYSDTPASAFPWFS
jgi:hypothetical protein